MKIKLSRTQWEATGRRAGWLKQADLNQGELNELNYRDERATRAYQDSTNAPEGTSYRKQRQLDDIAAITEIEARNIEDEIARKSKPLPEDVKRMEPFSLASALYWYCAHYHGGQNSIEYSVLSTLGYKPGAMERGVNEDDYEGQDVYDRLVSKEIDPEALKDFIKEEYDKRD